MNRSYKTVTATPQRTTRNTYVSTPTTPVAQPVIQPQAKIELNLAPTPKPALAPTPMVTEENVKIVKFKVKNKVSGKVKRQRANRRLRRLLCPKTAVMALHELFTEEDNSKDIKIVVSDAQQVGEGFGKPNQGTQFKAEAMYQGKVYAGFGTSKQNARNNVAEKVLRDMVILKMKNCPKKPANSNGANGGDVDMADAAEEDEVPMTHLASYALHKLFAEWAEQGFEVPDFKNLFGGNDVSEAVESKVPAPRADLPPNAGSLHPSMLLAQMRPGIQYQDLGSQGTTPNVIHCMGVTVDGKQYIGNGKSKKFARREAARFACQEIFNVVFDPSIFDGK